MRIKLFVLIIFSTISCTKVLEINIPQHPQKPVVSCFFTKDSTFKMQLNSSVGILDEYQKPIIDAEVLLFEDDILVDTLEYKDGLFESDVLAKMGKTYSFSAKISNYKDISATSSIPEEPVLGECKIIDKIVVIDEEYPFDQELQIEIQDINSRKNYYELVCLIYYIDSYSNEEEYNSIYCYSTSPIIENEGFYYTEGVVFSDTLFNQDIGKIKINFSTPRNWNNESELIDYSMTVQLRSITKEYYVFKKKLSQHLFNQENDVWDGIGEPVQMYSNIANGYGIFSGYNEVRKEVLPE